MENPSKKTLKHMARVALNQNDPYNPINRDIRKWEKKSPKLAARERFAFSITIIRCYGLPENQRKEMDK